MAPSSKTTIRFHSLDALRASALLLGIVFHAALSFTPYKLEVTRWAVYDPSSSYVLGAVAYVSHIFRMEIFFLIAGFFAHMVYHRKGCKNFFDTRFKRIMVPFVLAWFLLYPFFIYLWIWGAIEMGTSSVSPEMQGRGVWWLTAGLMAQPRRFFFDIGFSLAHLWFLYYLFIQYLIVVLLRKIALTVLKNPNKMRGKIDRGLKTVISSRWMFLLAAIPIALSIYTMKDWYGVATPENKIFPHPLVPMVNSMFVYLIFFVAGWFLHRQTDLLEQFTRRWKGNTLVGLVLGTALSVLYMKYLHVESASEVRSIAWFRLGYCFLYGVAMLFLVFGVMGFFIKYFEKPNRTWRYLTDSSYWLYLIHLPFIVWLQVVLYRWDVHWALKFTLINIIAFPVMLLSYHILVRRTFIGQILNGRKYTRQKAVASRITTNP